jgi:hypothetical protein
MNTLDLSLDCHAYTLYLYLICSENILHIVVSVSIYIPQHPHSLTLRAELFQTHHGSTRLEVLIEGKAIPVTVRGGP